MAVAARTSPGTWGTPRARTLTVGMLRCLGLEPWRLAPDLVHAAIDDITVAPRIARPRRSARRGPGEVRSADGRARLELGVRPRRIPAAAVVLLLRLLYSERDRGLDERRQGDR